jgi:long-chain-fatty-acid--[acyl-carrier-protein] ligase
LEKLSKQPDGPLLAVLADEKESGKTKLVLVSTVEVDKQEINEMLKNSGFSRLIKIAQVKHIDEIPLMGTGKIDYRYLQSWIE